MHDRRMLFGSTLVTLSLAGSVFLSSPASAASNPSRGSCPAAFTSTADEAYPGQSDPLLLDRNGDGVVCWTRLQVTPHDPTQYYQVVDNNAGGKPKS